MKENHNDVKGKKTISDFVKNAYITYLGIYLGDQDKTWASHFE